MADEALNPGGNTTKGRHGRPAGKGNALDGFLKFIIGGKYKWLRYAKFEDFLVEYKKMSREGARKLVSILKETGIGESAYLRFSSEVREWQRIRKSSRGAKGGQAKAKKYPKWSKERRQNFLIRKMEQLNKKEGLT